MKLIKLVIVGCIALSMVGCLPSEPKLLSLAESVVPYDQAKSKLSKVLTFTDSNYYTNDVEIYTFEHDNIKYIVAKSNNGITIIKQ